MMRGLPRYLLCAACVAGLAASARFAIAPPRLGASAVAVPLAPSLEPAAEGYAVLFARRYLSWDASQPQLSAQALTPIAGTALAPNVGLTLPTRGEQHVEWAEVVQSRRVGAEAHVYTVAAQTDSSGLRYLTVEVARNADGRLVLDGYPAFVGPPAESAAEPPARTPEVDEPALSTVVERALRNYLADASEELAADLARDARVSLPEGNLRLESLQRLGWSEDRRSVLAVVQAADPRGARYTLGYELDVTDRNGRWEVSAIQMDPRE
jgi:Conjugative transposon protein TcpC